MTAASTPTLTVTTPTDHQIVMTRVLPGTRTRVYEAMVTPELLKQWVGPRGWQLQEVEIDTRVGGRYRYSGSYPKGGAMSWGGEIRELTPNERVVQTEKFEAFPGEAINTTTWAEQDGVTMVTIVMEYESREMRDGVLASGMPQGVSMSYDRLEALLTRGW